MPLFGSRMVCETANYKHIEETKRKFAQREETLGDWAKEKNERKAALQELKLQTKQVSESRSRRNSLVLSPGSEAAGDISKSALAMAATMTATATMTAAILHQPSSDIKVPDINVEDQSYDKV